MTPRIAKALRRDERGSATVEAAVAMPFILILGLGALEFGFALYQYQVVVSGLRLSARYLAHAPKNVDLNASLVEGSSPAQSYATFAKNIAVMNEDRTAPRVKGWTTAVVTVTATANVITISTAFSPEGLGFTSVIGLDGALTLNAQYEERRIGY